MSKRVGPVLALLLLVALAAAAWWAGATTVDGTSTDAEGTTPTTDGIPSAATPATVEYVHDGDTLFLDDGRKVRLLGIDTPEVGEHAECYGDEATALLRSLLPEGSSVRVLADVQPLDQYGRSLLFVYRDDATLVNLAMLESGAAEAVVLEPNVLFAERLRAAEDDARAAGLGLWGACG
jgi:micrococcal nuclease